MRTDSARWRYWVAVGLTTALAGCGQQAGGGWDAGPPVVEVLQVQPRPLAVVAELPGRIEPVRVAEVRARVAGIVLSRDFQEGADVKAGEVLFRIDPQPLRAALSRAQGELARAEAVLTEANAVMTRYEPLVAIEAVSRQDFDTAQAAFKSAQAQRQSAAAAVESARLDLSYATVTAPISGRIGRGLVTEGALVGQGEPTVLAIIQQLDPVHADFKQPLADAMRWRQRHAEGGEAGLRIAIDGVEQLREGRMLFSDITVDRSTGQISLRGEFPNADGLLLPGMYVRVHLEQERDEQAILVPQRSVRPVGEGQGLVMVIDAEDVAQAREVRTGAMHGGDWHILEGLAAGERIVTDGNASAGEKVSIAGAPAAPAAAEPSAAAVSP